MALSFRASGIELRRRMLTCAAVPRCSKDQALTKSFTTFRGPAGRFSWTHPMGTNNAGRDIFARVLSGGQISLMVALIATLVSLLIGVSYGATAGYLGGRIDAIMMRVVD